MESSIVGQIIDEIVEMCFNGTMPLKTIETIESGDSMDAVKESDNKAITAQIGEDANGETNINEPFERDGDEFSESVDYKISPETIDPLAGDHKVITARAETILDEEMDTIGQMEKLELDETFIDGEMSPETIETIESGDSMESGKEGDNKAITAQIGEDAHGETNINEQLERDGDKFSETSVDYEMSPETIGPITGDHKVVTARAEENLDEEMDTIGQMEKLELDETFIDGEMSPERIEYADYEETVEEFKNMNLKEIRHEGTDVMDQLEVLERDCDLANAGDNDITQSTRRNASNVETLNDKMAGCSSGVKPQSNTGNVATATEADLLRSKGFATRVCLSSRNHKVCNLFLLQSSSKFTPQHIRCVGLPSAMTDYELISLFEKCGPVFILIRIREDLIFVTYTNAEDADRAVKLFNCRNIRGHMVTVSRRMPLNRLVVKGISPFATKQHLFQRFKSVSSNLQSVQLFNDLMNEGRIRRFCYLIYDTYEAAVEAMQRIGRLCRDVIVEFANRRLEWTKTPDTLYITNLRSSMSEAELRKLFSVYGKIMFLRMYRNFGKVQFGSVEDAALAADKIDKRRLGNENVDVSLCRTYVKHVRDQNTRRLSFASRDMNNGQMPSNTRDKKSRPSSSGTGYRDSRPSSANMRDRKLRPSSSDIPDRKSPPSTGIRDGESPPSSTDKRARKSSDTLYLNNLRPTMTAHDLRTCFSVYGEVVTADRENTSAEVRFRKEKDAKRAAQHIDKSLLGNDVKISFVKQMETSDTLYIYNMFDEMTVKQLRTLFSKYGKVMDVDFNGGCATVGFRCKASAEDAMKGVSGSALGEANVEILFFPKGKH